jgi:endo-1,4-beta-xylanase
MKKRTSIFILTALFLLFATIPRQEAIAEEVNILIDFEFNAAMGVKGRGTERVAVTEEEAYSGSYSLLTTNRTNSWNGPSLNVEAFVVPGVTCEVSVWVLPKDPESLSFTLSTQIGNGSGASYINLSSKTVSKDDGWTELSGSYTYPNSNYITIYVESSNATAEFYIDDLSFYVPEVESPDRMEALDLPSLYEPYQNYFLLGTAVGPTSLAGDTFEVVKRHFNVVTLENQMKPEALSRLEDNFTFNTADEMLDTLEEAGLLVHGHTLVWHSQSADWLNKNPDGSYLTRSEARANMRTYIDKVVKHYAGRVISWDVVNEAFKTSLSSIGDDWRAGLRTGAGPINEVSAWYAAYENGADTEAGESGADYIYDAFVFTRLADPEAILYYNDFNETETGKREAIALMTEELNEKWRTDRRNTDPDRLLIEGLGMQAHYWLARLNIDDVNNTILRWKETGVEISISELDIPTGDWTGYAPFTDLAAIRQGQLYAQLFLLFKEHSDVISRVTVWGLDDMNSWRREGSPLLFGTYFAAKPAYYAVLDPEGYLNGEYHAIFEQAEAPTPEPSPEALPEAPPEEIGEESPIYSGDDYYVPPNDSTFLSRRTKLVIFYLVAGAACLALVRFISYRHNKKFRE